MEDGKYAVYKSHTFKASLDGETKKINLYSSNKFSAEFSVSRLRGYYSLAVDRSKISEAYELKTYGVIGNDKFELIGKSNNKVIFCTYDSGLAKKYSFQRYGHSEYRKEISDCKLVQVKSPIWSGVK